MANCTYVKCEKSCRSESAELEHNGSSGDDDNLLLGPGGGVSGLGAEAALLAVEHGVGALDR